MPTPTTGDDDPHLTEALRLVAEALVAHRDGRPTSAHTRAIAARTALRDYLRERGETVYDYTTGGVRP